MRWKDRNRLVAWAGFFSLTAICFSKADAQALHSVAATDSMVQLAQRKVLDAGSDDIFPLFRRFGCGVKRSDLGDALAVVSEIKCQGDTVYIREFFSMAQELIFLREEHFIYRENEIVDSAQGRDYSLGYSAYYYVEDQFYKDGAMRYGAGFTGYSYGPEPISYVRRMVLRNADYLQSK